MSNNKKQRPSDYKIIVENNDDPNAPSLKDIMQSAEFKEIVRKILLEKEGKKDDN